MRIATESFISHPIAKVYTAYRDRMPEVVRFLPDIKEIKVAKREEQGDLITLHNIWYADRDIPGFAQAFIKKDMLCWDDFARWSDAEQRCSWVISPHVFTEAVRCQGTTSFVAATGGTRVRLEGDLSLDLAKVKVVPGLLARTLGPKLEGFVVELIKPNLERTNGAIQQFLDAQR